MDRWRLRNMRVGFFFNHDQCHQVAHSLPIALSLIRNVPEVEVAIATANPRLTAEVRRLAAACGVIVPVVELGLRRPLTRLMARKLNGIVPAAKLAIYRDNLDFFRSLDA